MEEAGEDYQAIIDLPFKMIEVEEIQKVENKIICRDNRWYWIR